MPDLSIFADEPHTAAYPAGHHFMNTGDVGDTMYVVLAGEVDVLVHGKVMETVGTGGVFGEMALIDHRERSADVIAKTEVKAAAIDQKRFMYLIRNHPYFAIEVMKVMTDRLRRFDDLL
jgi:CRP-like cAMP-binding protein